MESIQKFAFGLVGLACLLFCAALAERLTANLRARSWTGAVVSLIVLAASLFCFLMCFESGAIPSEMRAAFWFAHARRAEEAASLNHLEVLSPALGDKFARPGRSVLHSVR